MKQRYAHIKLLYGGWVGNDGRPTGFAAPAAIFRYNDAVSFLQKTRLYDRSDYLWGASVEMLPKRKSYPTAITEERFQILLADATLVRLESQAVQYEQQAAYKHACAKDDEKRAAEFTAKAAEIRARIKFTETPGSKPAPLTS